jgi:hypothetical protein
MPLSPINFQNLDPYAGFKSSNELQRGQLANTAQSIENQYRPDILQQDVMQKKLANALSQQVLPYAAPQAAANLGVTQAQAPNIRANTQSTLAGIPGIQAQGRILGAQANIAPQTAQAGLESTQLSNDLMRQTNPLARAKEQAQIDQIKAMQNYYNQGGAKAGVGQKEQQYFQSLVGQDNPHLKGDPAKLYAAANALARGETTLPDGTPLNPLSPAAQQSLDRLAKGASTAALVNTGVKANQAEAELSKLSELAGPSLKEYGTTYAGYSPQQIVDSTKSDEKSQKRLGQFIAAQAMQYEMAQIRNRIAGGEPGITATQELMHRSGQVINTYFPKLSSTAREEARTTMDDWLGKALKARQDVGIRPSQLSRFGNKKKGSAPVQQPSLHHLTDDELMKIAGQG